MLILTREFDTTYLVPFSIKKYGIIITCFETLNPDKSY